MKISRLVSRLHIHYSTEERNYHKSQSHYSHQRTYQERYHRNIRHIPSKIDVIYHGCSLQSTISKPNLHLPQRYILFVGDRTSYKNFQRLAEAFSIIHQTDAHLHLICAGKPFSKAESELISRIGIASHTLRISVNDQHLKELYNRALLFVYPSYYEGFGIPILEAYTCNCPVALSQASCFPEIAENAAAYFDPFSVSSMAEAIKSVIYDEAERTRLILAGKKGLNFTLGKRQPAKPNLSTGKQQKQSSDHSFPHRESVVQFQQEGQDRLYPLLETVCLAHLTEKFKQRLLFQASSQLQRVEYHGRKYSLQDIFLFLLTKT